MKKKIIFLIFGVFLFITSIEALKSGWGIIGGGLQKQLVSMITSKTSVFVGLAIGLLATSLVQSSSAVVAATMATLAGMVASGVPLSSAVGFGVPVVLGANVGTTVTNTVVALGHARDGDEFESAVPGAIVHDIFNVLNVTFFLFLELFTGILSYTAATLSRYFYGAVQGAAGNIVAVSPLGILVERPIVQPLSSVLTGTFGNFYGGIFSVIIAFFGLLVGLTFISKNVRQLVDESSLQEKIFRTFKRPVHSVFTGTSVTWILQSSSVATSLALPFLATDTIDLKQMYSYSLGCNIGTTIDLSQIYGYAVSGMTGLALGLTHVMVNVFGVAIWLFTPLRFIPLHLAQRLGGTIIRRKGAPLVLILYVGSVFFLLPSVVIFFS